MTDTPEPSPPLLYLGYVFGGALLIMASLIYAGFHELPFLATVLIGAAVQLVFRALKPVLRHRAQSPQAQASAAASWSFSAFGKLALAYLLMIAVCALWYGIGSFIQRA